MRFISGLAILASFTSTALAVVGPGVVTGDTSVHDPTMCKDSAGKYWIFSTGVGLEIRTSTDRTAWSKVGLVWPSGASWTDAYTGTSNGALWAPDCQIANSKFRLFYSASTFGSQKSAIFLATSSTGAAGSWTHVSKVIETSSSNDYNAIDPNLFISSGGSWYLSLGSWWTGIKMAQVDSTGVLKSSVSSLANRGGSGIEASVIYQYGSYFYLFTSWDVCCQGTSSTYNIRVGRSTSVGGTYTDKSGVSLLSGGGTSVLATHDSIYGPGGQDVWDDSDGPILIYHYYTSSGHWLGINRLDFSSGWPVVT
ncbi:glycoside hydrolase family 43 protein [Flagelloscypha sp. PMI_526]|nr:glycoside hydrolase family 43 protein [Flagelloscypha sp. PMI_526]